MKSKVLYLSLSKIMEWFIALFYILELNTVYFRSYNYNFYISEILCILIVGYLFILRPKITKKTGYILVFYFIYEFVYFLSTINKSSLSLLINYIIKFIVVIPVVVIIYSYKSSVSQRIQYYFSEIVVALAFLSCITFIFAQFVDPLYTFTIDWGNQIDTGGYIFFYKIQWQEILGNHYLRNTGIFCEAPMYGFALVMALITQLNFDGKSKRRNVIILLITILTTLSATAIALSMSLIAIKLYKTNDENSKIREREFRIIILMFITFVMAVAIYRLFIFKRSTGLSMTKRLDDYYAGYQLWKTNPFFGVGYGNGELVKQYFLDWRKKYTSAGFSNAVMTILSTMGIYGSILYVLAFIRGIVICSKKKMNTMKILYIYLIILLLVTTLPMQLYVLQFISFGISDFNKGDLDNYCSGNDRKLDKNTK